MSDWNRILYQKLELTTDSRWEIWPTQTLPAGCHIMPPVADKVKNGLTWVYKLTTTSITLSFLPIVVSPKKLSAGDNLRQVDTYMTQIWTC